MNSIALELAIIFLLLLANGVFSMTEIAVVSVRKARLRRLAESGDDRARAALALAESPNRFLSTVQVGITLVGVLAAAFRACVKNSSFRLSSSSSSILEGISRTRTTTRTRKMAHLVFFTQALYAASMAATPGNNLPPKAVRESKRPESRAPRVC